MENSEKITLPLTLNYSNNNVIGEVIVEKKYEQLLWNMHLAPGFVIKEYDIKKNIPERIEMKEFALINDTQFTNWNNEKFYSQSQVDEIVRQIKNAKALGIS